MSQLKSKTLLCGVAAGLLWIGPGSSYMVAQDTTPPTAPEDTFLTPGTRMDRFTSTVVTEPRTVIQFTGNLGTFIPGTRVEFTQHGAIPQAVVVTFSADWPKPRQDEIPVGSFGAGVVVRPEIHSGSGSTEDPIGRQLAGVTLFEGGGVATASSVSNGSHSFTFVTDPLPSGDYVIEMLAFSQTLGQPGQPNGTAVLRGRSTVVQHD
jgi:hypothetical protein